MTIQPLIIAPYISRILGAEGLGKYTFSFAIVGYFVMFTMLGVNNFGNRSVSQVRDNREKLSSTFINIYTLQLIAGAISVSAYVFFIILYDNDIVFILQVFLIISSMFDITWFFFGLEQFKLTVLRNTIIKTVSIIAILLFVNEETDLWIYVIIMSGGALLSQLLLWLFVKNHINFVKPSVKEMKKMIKPNLTLFIPVVAISLYRQMNKIMLGIASTMTQVALFENAARINQLPLGLLTSVSAVMLPKMSNMVIQGSEDEVKKFIGKSMTGVMLFAFATAFGLAAIAEDFAPLFFGKEFKMSGTLIVYTSPSIIIMAWANVIRTQYLIPYERDRIYIISILSAAILNITFNIFALSRWGAVGAAWGVVLAEAIVAIYQSWAVRKELNIKRYLKDSMIFFISGVLMYMSVRFFVSLFSLEGWIMIGVKVLTGAIVYFGIVGFWFVGLKKIKFSRIYF